MQKTIENLTKAFIGESQARNRYTMYSKIAKKEGYEKIFELFSLTADQEAEHAKWLMRMINDLKKDDNDIIVEAGAPTILADTVANLKAAIAGENHEHTSMYPEYADVAQEEGFPEIATRLRSIARAEDNHETRFKAVLEEIETKTVFEKGEEVVWQCRKCGYSYTGKKAVEECPSCGHPQAYFEVRK